MEVPSIKEANDFLQALGYSIKDTVSCTVDEIYKNLGIDSLNIRELKF